MSAVAPRQERYFNPRSHEGSDELGLLIAQVAGIFQSSLPRGERPTPKPATTAGSDFNPRSHEGSDGCTGSVCTDLCISILAPTRGATAGSMRQSLRKAISILAPTRGATVRPDVIASIGSISILAPTRGATAIFAKKFSFLSAKIV